MGDSHNRSNPMGNPSGISNTTIVEKPKGHVNDYRNIAVKHKSLGEITSSKNRKFGIVGGPVASFLLKVAALEVVRRCSKARCPIVWSGLQALQVFCYPPLKFIQRWNPFGAFVKGMQMLSRPLLVLSVATAFSDRSGDRDSHLDEDFHAINRTHIVYSPRVQPTPNMSDGDESSQSPQKSWLLKLHEELEDQGILLPERLDEEELQRFYAAAHGNFSTFLALVKKTIAWRETFRLLSMQELEKWETLVFWHGFEIRHQPCLIVRLGLACMTVPFNERPRFAQAIVSQVEHGVLHLLDHEYPRITVLVDCEGLSPLRVPMQIMRSCSSILQEHFPKRLGYVFVIRLPPVARVLAQTFIQFLRPGTRAKLKVVGRMYQKELTEYVQILPSYLGGECTCMKCTKPVSMDSSADEMSSGGTRSQFTTDEFITDEFLTSLDQSYEIEAMAPATLNRALRTAVVGILILWVILALIAGLSDHES